MPVKRSLKIKKMAKEAIRMDQTSAIGWFSLTVFRYPLVESPPLPTGQELLPYLDAFLESVHPVCCNNFLHPGILGEGIHRAPRILVLAICGSSSKFLGGVEHRERGQRWIAMAKSLICQELNKATTLTISAIQFIIMHDMHEGNFTSASNFVGM